MASSSLSNGPNSLAHTVRSDFPILNQVLDCKNNASTSQKPAAVLDAMRNYYESYNSTVHRGVHSLSTKATDEYERVRKKVAEFVNASDAKEIVFTRNATEAINLVAYIVGGSIMSKVEMSALVPWQFVARRTGVILKFASLTAEEVPDVEELRGMLSAKTKIVVVHHISNVLGSTLPIDQVVSLAHDIGAKVLIDACQSVPHMPVDVKDLDADFLAAASHKMCGPTGVGFLYAKSELLSNMPPFLGGGEMISEVYTDHSTYVEPPLRFEAGTPSTGEVIGLGATIDYLSGIGMQKIHEYEVELAGYLYKSLQVIANVRVYGPAPSKSRSRAALCAFNVEGCNPTYIATYLDRQHGIAIRSGHHCAQPLHRYLGIDATAQASLYFYSTKEDVDYFVQALQLFCNLRKGA